MSRAARIAAGVAVLTGLAACGQIIGSDKNRHGIAADAGVAADTGVAADAGLATMRDAQAQPNKPPPPCPDGQKKCDGMCVAIDDPAFGCGLTTCNHCSLPFAATTKCTAGACTVATCGAGHADCNDRGDDGCEADLTDAKTCGNCKTACGAGAVFCTPFGSCAADCGALTACGTTCVDLTAGAPKHCGSCDHTCPLDPNNSGDAVCSNSTCSITCHAGFADCDKSTFGCEPLHKYYADADGDGFGAGAFVEACTQPASYVAVAGDCLDTNKAVHPGEAAYFTTGYAAPGGRTSFDYDCSGGEEGDPVLFVSKSCNPCSTGYGAAAPARGPNALCGSTIFNSCGAELTNVCMTAAAPAAYGCR